MEKAVSAFIASLSDLQSHMLQMTAAVYTGAAAFLLASALACIASLCYSERNKPGRRLHIPQ